jgi:hypothetical protein
MSDHSFFTLFIPYASYFSIGFSGPLYFSTPSWLQLRALVFDGPTLIKSVLTPSSPSHTPSSSSSKISDGHGLLGMSGMHVSSSPTSVGTALSESPTSDSPSSPKAPLLTPRALFQGTKPTPSLLERSIPISNEPTVPVQEIRKRPKKSGLLN